MLLTCLPISHEMQPGATRTGSAGSLVRRKLAEPPAGRDEEMVRDEEGTERVVGCEVILSHRVFYSCN